MKKYTVKKAGSQYQVVCELYGQEFVVEVKKSHASALAIATLMNKGVQK